MQEMLPLPPQNNPNKEERILLDVNSLAIFLVKDHPGNEHISEVIERSLKDLKDILIMDYLPMRAHWVMTSKWGVDEKASREAIKSLLDSQIKIVKASKSTIIDSFSISNEKGHDIYDSFYISLARQENADYILTTDTDFKELCRDEDFDYLNPVPDRILKKFQSFNKD